MRLHRRALHPGPEPGGCQQDPFSPGCSPPLPTVPSTYNPGPGLAPSPPPSMLPPWLTACPPPVFVAPAPAPAPAPVNTGRRDQGGTYGYGPPPPVGGGGADDHRRNFVTYALIAAGVIAFLSLILLGVSVAVRRRQVRRRRQALLAPAAPSNADDGGGNGPEGGGGAGVVHHIWYIRTVGLDEAAINSIAVTQYRAGAGLLGAADCSVCLGEFQDGELVRLLPKCGHAFHVPCIDTWLRAHVNCPLCRSDVLDDAAAAAESGESSGSSDPPSDPDANANDAADQAAAASDAAPDHEQEEEEEESDGRDSPPAEESRQGQSSCPEPSPLACPLPRNVRRAASMDAVTVSTTADVAALDQLPEATPEEEQEIGGGRKRGTGPSFAKASGSGHRGNNLSTDRPASGGVPRSFFSRHCRARSSVLPL